MFTPSVREQTSPNKRQKSETAMSNTTVVTPTRRANNEPNPQRDATVTTKDQQQPITAYFQQTIDSSSPSPTQVMTDPPKPMIESFIEVRDKTLSDEDAI